MNAARAADIPQREKPSVDAPNGHRPVPAHALGEVMSALALTLQQDFDSVEDTLNTITSSALDLVPAATDASISLVIARRSIESRAPTSDLARQVDTLQSGLGQGPCIDAVWTDAVVAVPDTASERRWPRFSPAAAELGVRSMLCFQLYTHRDNLGALNLMSDTPGAFDDDAHHTGTLVATHAAVALIAAEHQNQMKSALATRDVIGQAKGIVMERYDVSATRAFEMINKLSHDWNVPVAELARTITARDKP